MKILVKSRDWFKKMRRENLVEVLSKCKAVSIQSTFGWDSRPPFPNRFLPHPNVICLRFDDCCSIDEGCDNRDSLPLLFDRGHAERIMRFINEDDQTVVVQCTAGISRSGAIGQALDWYFNSYIEQNPADHQFFVETNPQIRPNRLVLEVMMNYLKEEC